MTIAGDLRPKATKQTNKVYLQTNSPSMASCSSVLANETRPPITEPIIYTNQDKRPETWNIHLIMMVTCARRVHYLKELQGCESFAPEKNFQYDLCLRPISDTQSMSKYSFMIAMGESSKYPKS